MNRQRLSAARKRIHQLQQAMEDDLRVFLERTPLLKGRLYEAQTRCGKPGCRCNRGELHTAMVLAYRGGEKQYNRCPADQDIPLLHEMTGRYQDFRQARARLVKASRELLEQIGVMERERLALGEERFRKTETGKRVP
ncbi:MAG: hypothetical protein KAY24_17420 [Candidatus Eisenbacteria sp.]|nr:hypothetical protein [Candidatus Eisenbacteria bacterium]